MLVFPLFPGLLRLSKFTLSKIEIKIPTKVSSVHFNNLKISQLQRHLHGEGKKWVGQNRQNENARQIVISFFCVLLLTDCCCCYFCTFILFQDWLLRSPLPPLPLLLYFWLIVCAPLSRTTMICWHFLYVRTNLSLRMRVCVYVCMCVCARNPFALYFLTTSTSHFFIHFYSDREGFFLLIRKNPAS